MKISKLFHWLYACLLLLPIACFLPNAFYYGFNAQAQASERIEEEQVFYSKSNPNETYSVNDLQENTLYRFDFQILDDGSFVIQFDYIEIADAYIYEGSYTEPNTLNQTPYFEFRQDGYTYQIQTNTTYYWITHADEDWWISIIAVVNSNTNFSTITIDYDLDISGCDLDRRNGNNTYETTYTNSITDSMSVAWQQTWSNPLFSWAQNSFIALPFAYITNIFSIPVSNTFTIALSYWLSISVIWLCFDVLMYVPMLVHRWLDRSAIK